VKTTGAPLWKVSSYSDGGNCVEVAAYAASILVRDGKEVDIGVLALPPARWADFAATWTTCRP